MNVSPRTIRTLTALAFVPALLGLSLVGTAAANAEEAPSGPTICSTPDNPQAGAQLATCGSRPGGLEPWVCAPKNPNSWYVPSPYCP